MNDRTSERDLGTETSNAAQDVEALKEDLKRLRQDMASLTDSLKKVAQEGAEVGRSRAQDELERLYEEFKELYESVRQESGRAKTTLEKEIGQRPFTSVLGALAVGIVLGKFMSAR